MMLLMILALEKELEFIHEILEMGSGADRQIKVYEARRIPLMKWSPIFTNKVPWAYSDDVGPYIKDIR
jgi:hypothetical protein